MKTDGKIHALPEDEYARFRRWLIECGATMLDVEHPYVIRFELDGVERSLQKRSKRRSWLSFGGAASLYRTYVLQKQKLSTANNVAIELFAQALRDKAEMTIAKFCKDCSWHAFDRDERGKIYHECSCPALLNRVTGQNSPAAANRNNESSCGRNATFFRAKNK